MEEESVHSRVGERWSSFSREQKTAVILLSICGFLALGFSLQRIGSTVTDPFTVSRSSLVDARKKLDELNPEQRLIAESKRRDTDGDGLSDYDEENTFHTSPYLKDTDGDSVPDNVELAQGENPLCMKGKDCSLQTVDTSGLQTSSTFMVDSDKPLVRADQPLAEMQRSINEYSQNISAKGQQSPQAPILVRDPVEIRNFLLQSGQVPSSTVMAMTDDQLLQVYDQAAKEINAEQQAGTVSSTPSTTSSQP